METPRVYLKTCREYEVAALQAFVAGAIADLGVTLPSQGKVLLKPNVLGPYPPEQAIDTHPAVVEAVIRILLDSANEITIADSSGKPGGTDECLEKSGIKALEAQFDRVSVHAFEELPTRLYTNPENTYLKEVHLPRILEEVDCIINLPKLKTHMLTRFTGAVKNLFGCIPGGGKQVAHTMAPTPRKLSELLVDLYGFIKPCVTLNIMDAIVGIEAFGPGPTGKVVNTGFMAAATDAVAMDRAVSQLVGFEPDSVFTNRIAVDRGLGVEDFKLSETLSIPPIRKARRIPLEDFLLTCFPTIPKSKPTVVRTDACQQCGICADACPVHCITMNGLPEWDYEPCIYCYCCHENCPHAAIDLKGIIYFGVKVPLKRLLRA